MAILLCLARPITGENLFLMTLAGIGMGIIFLLLIWVEIVRIRDWNEEYQLRQSHQELLNFMRVVRSQRHDFNLHIQAIANLIRSQDYENCQKYMDTFLRNVSRTNEVFLVHDPAVSALLSTYFELGQSRDIDMQFDICHNMEGAVLKDYQLNTVLGNLLQNAIDEVDTHKNTDERWILLYVMKRGRKLLFKVSNPYFGDIAKLDHAFDMGYSTKEFHEGVGLSNVKRILDLHHGSIGIEYRKDVLSVIAQIPLNII